MTHWPGAREDLFSGVIADLPGVGGSAVTDTVGIQALGENEHILDDME